MPSSWIAGVPSSLKMLNSPNAVGPPATKTSRPPPGISPSVSKLTVNWSPSERSVSLTDKLTVGPLPGITLSPSTTVIVATLSPMRVPSRPRISTSKVSGSSSIMSSNTVASKVRTGAVKLMSNSGSRFAIGIKPSSGLITDGTFPSTSPGAKNLAKSPAIVIGTPPSGIGPSTVKVTLMVGLSSSLTTGVVVETETAGKEVVVLVKAILSTPT